MNTTRCSTCERWDEAKGQWMIYREGWIPCPCQFDTVEEWLEVYTGYAVALKEKIPPRRSEEGN